MFRSFLNRVSKAAPAAEPAPQPEQAQVLIINPELAINDAKSLLKDAEALQKQSSSFYQFLASEEFVNLIKEATVKGRSVKLIDRNYVTPWMDNTTFQRNLAFVLWKHGYDAKFERDYKYCSLVIEPMTIVPQEFRFVGY